MFSRPLVAGGHQHSRAIVLGHRPPGAFVDPLVGLDNLAAGWVFPLVEIVEETSHGVTVLVSVFGEGPGPTAQEQADIDGTVAELMWVDDAGQRRG